MGGCVSSSQDRSDGGVESSDNAVAGSMPLGRNQPLKQEKPKWKSDVPLTVGQLRSKRDEFWDTAPAFEGRKEIWDALKAAAQALENGDHALAQAIIDGANITCPNGTLTDCYDELGNRYVLPVYCLSPPINMIEETSESDAGDMEPINTGGVETTIRLRLSTNKDRKMTVRTTDTVLQVKRKIHTEEGIEPSRQRWFFSGRLLNDKTKIEDAKIPKGFIVQIVVSPQNPTPVEN
ncbi:ubiquitin domain-containing protein 2-like [Saccoglossus kowalevskii]|uniref:Ubiquitin domain-containing protein 2-like n=1 Tax=Saccoglossus kowalevskii TaxID=10224 RepID=A0ABM0GQV8_SACKO|nr:PREDICTED: ubiquitin domain-containing protein 2-like [Saccoglossus kowalevskii]